MSYIIIITANLDLDKSNCFNFRMITTIKQYFEQYIFYNYFTVYYLKNLNWGLNVFISYEKFHSIICLAKVKNKISK